MTQYRHYIRFYCSAFMLCVNVTPVFGILEIFRDGKSCLVVVVVVVVVVAAAAAVVVVVVSSK